MTMLSLTAVMESDEGFGTVCAMFVVGCAWVFEVGVGCRLVVKAEATDSSTEA